MNSKIVKPNQNNGQPIEKTAHKPLTKTKEIKHSGLSDTQVLKSRKAFGTNEMLFKKTYPLVEALKRIVREPMILLLLLASFIYFITGKTGDGYFLLGAIGLVSAISLFQDTKSKQALAAIRALNQPKSKVIRNGETVEIDNNMLVIDDIIIVSEGVTINGDALVLQSNDFSVNESILTGESMPVKKNLENGQLEIFSGTTVATGMAIAKVVQIGNNTKIGKIGGSLIKIKPTKTPLEVQINKFVLRMALIGGIVFIIVWAFNYMHSHQLLNSLLNALTLAMSILPEEIPFAFTSFMALGAWRLMKKGIIVKQMKTIETLGSANVICIDKTGTITKNKMTVAKFYVLKTNKFIAPTDALDDDSKNIVRIAMLASDPEPYDTMDIALHNIYKEIIAKDNHTKAHMVHEYALSGKPPMTTHIYEEKNIRIAAAKGAPEAFMTISKLTKSEESQINKALEDFAREGYRVLGIGSSKLQGHHFPKSQHDIDFEFLGLVAFFDPPKENINAVLNQFYQAGINVKIITGDNALTTATIAKQIGFAGYDKNTEGATLMTMDEDQLKKAVLEKQVFSRMFPEAKLKVIQALKSIGQVVAMVGDGVNDSLALKEAHIGIAMGTKGTDIAKQAASIVLVEDDLSKMLDAVAMGRRIYMNLKKAIRFIVSIHIPIVLIVFIPLVLGWKYANIFSPIHIIFFELIMGPTCSIVYENEPLEKGAMEEPPRQATEDFFNLKELTFSIVQGLMITIGLLTIYYITTASNMSEMTTRTMIFMTLIASNIFLTLENRSFTKPLFKTIAYKNELVATIIGITLSLACLILYVPFFTTFFQFVALDLSQLGICVGIGFASVMWIEIPKVYRHKY